MKWSKELTQRIRGRRPALRKLVPAVEAFERRQLLASTILFSPDGNPAHAVSIGGIDPGVGNALAVGGAPLAKGTTFQLDYQASVADLIDPNGNPFVPAGLNTSYQLTVVASVTEVVTGIGGPPLSPTATFALAPVQNNSFVEFYYNPAVVANDLAGTGFNVGTRILSAMPSPSLPNVGNFTIAAGSIQPFDQFDGNNYPGTFSVVGNGGSLLNGNVLQADPAFFRTPVSQLAFNTNNAAPFLETDPSARFVSSPNGSPPTVIPNLSPVNGLFGPDFQFQSDATVSFTAAAPAIAIQKATNGQIAPTPTGPVVPVGSTVTFTYTVTNPGNVPLSNVTVVDDNGTPTNPADDFKPTFTGGDVNGNGLLDPGEVWTYTATRIATPGQYTNVATATGTPPPGAGGPVTSTATSNNFGVPPGIAIVKMTAGQPAPVLVTSLQRLGVHHQPTRIVLDFNTDLDPARAQDLNNYRLVAAGPGGTFGTPHDQVIPLKSAVYDPTTRTVTLTPVHRLPLNQSFQLTVNGTAPGGLTDLAGNFLNGNGVGGPGSDFVTTFGRGSLQFPPKQGNPSDQDAAGAIGPVVLVGSNVTFTYAVTNTTDQPLKNVTVIDDNGTPTNPADDFKPTFTGGDVNGNGLLDPGEVWTYTATKAATAGQYTNVATVTGLSLTGVPVSAVAVSHFFGLCPTVVDLARFGVHKQPTRIVLTYNGPIDPAVAQNLNNYQLVSPGRDQIFGTRDDRVIPLKSAVYDPAARTVTLTTSERLNLHHIAQVTAKNPCPPGPDFVGVLNRKFSVRPIFNQAGGATGVHLSHVLKGPRHHLTATGPVRPALPRDNPMASTRHRG